MYVLVGENAKGFKVLSTHPDEGAADDAASDFIDDSRYDRLHVAEIITTIG